MKYQQDLQVRLQERYRRLYKVALQLYRYEAGYLVDYIRSTSALRYLIDEVERSEPELDPALWLAENFGWRKAEWPPTEAGRVKVAWHLLLQWTETDDAAAMFGLTLDPSQTNLAEGARQSMSRVLLKFGGDPGSSQAA